MKRPETLETLKTSDLIPYVNNSRTHTASQISKVAASIQEFGFTNPILIGSGNEVIAGHARLQAAIKLGMEYVPVLRLGYLTAAQRKAYVIADNRLALDAGWDEEILKIELACLNEVGYDLKNTGFEPDELNDLVSMLNGSNNNGSGEGSGEGDGEGQEEDRPPEDQIITQPGDLYTIGGHFLLCGDSTMEEDMERLTMEPDMDIILTDPPYGVAVSGAGGKSIHGDLTNTAISGFFPLAYNRLKPGKPIYMFGGQSNHSQYSKMFEIWCRMLPHIIIWVKENHVLRHADYHSKYEILAYGWKQGGKVEDRWYGDRKQNDVWEVQRVHSSKYIHPTEKSIALAIKILENSSQPGAKVLEPFGGSGSTMHACQVAGRVCYTMEVDPYYCDKIVKRMRENFPDLPIYLNGEAF